MATPSIVEELVNALVYFVGKCLVVVEPLQSAHEEVQAGGLLVGFVKRLDLVYHVAESVHYEGGSHYSEQEQEGSDHSLDSAPWVEITQPYSGQRSENKVQKLQGCLERAMIIDVKELDKIVFSCLGIGLSSKVRHNEPHYTGEVADGHDDEDELEGDLYLGHEHDHREFGVVFEIG